MKYCTKCGAKMMDGDRFCEKCGAAARPSDAVFEEKRTDENGERPASDRPYSGAKTAAILLGTAVLAAAAAFATFFLVFR